MIMPNTQSPEIVIILPVHVSALKCHSEIKKKKKKKIKRN